MGQNDAIWEGRCMTKESDFVLPCMMHPLVFGSLMYVRVRSTMYQQRCVAWTRIFQWSFIIFVRKCVCVIVLTGDAIY